MGEPRWLDERQQRAWRSLAAVMLRLPIELERQLRRDAELTHFEYWVLAMLSETADRTLQLSDLAARASASLSRLSHVVTRLEDKGWLRRERCPGDARATNAVLTEAGWDKVVASAPGHVEEVRRLVFDGLDDQGVGELARACDAILERLAKRSFTVT
ncbi:MAG TPA: MarR family transcriptional regulator [Nitriliruptorales bacterium]